MLRTKIAATALAALALTAGPLAAAPAAADETHPCGGTFTSPWDEICYTPIRIICSVWPNLPICH